MTCPAYSQNAVSR